MHIGLFAPELPGGRYANGIITYVEVMKEALRNAGHRVSLVSPLAVRDWTDTVRPISADAGFAGRLQGRLDRFRPDVGAGRGADRKIAALVKHAYALTGFDLLEIEESFGFAGPIARALPCPVVMRLHGPHVFGREPVETEEERSRSALRIAAEERAFAEVAAITAPSARLMAATLTHYRIQPVIAEVIPNPMATAALDECWSADRAKLKQLLCVGRFDLRKGADIVVDAFAVAAAADPELTLVMAGPDVGLRTAEGGRIPFADYAAAHVPPHLHGRIRFLGSVGPEQVRELRRDSGLAIVGSRFENFAYSVAECMAIGAPAIVSDSFGNGEMIDDGKGGLVVPVGDAPALAAAILSLAGDAGRLAAMGRWNWQRCRDWLAPARVAETTVALYERVLAGAHV